MPKCSTRSAAPPVFDDADLPPCLTTVLPAAAATIAAMVDTLTAPEPCRTGNRFAPRRLPDDDPVAFVRARIGDLPSRYRVRATVHAPAERIRAEIVHYGRVRSAGDTSCEVEIVAESLDWAAFCLVAIGAPFVVHGPDEAINYMRAWGHRLAKATDPPSTSQ